MAGPWQGIWGVGTWRHRHINSVMSLLEWTWKWHHALQGFSRNSMILPECPLNPRVAMCHFRVHLEVVLCCWCNFSPPLFPSPILQSGGSGQGVAIDSCQPYRQAWSIPSVTQCIYSGDMIITESSGFFLFLSAIWNYDLYWITQDK